MNSFVKNHEFYTSNTQLKPLQWTMTDVGKSVIFLDLHIRLNCSTFSTTIYEKKLNLHLYIPPHSCHSPGVLKGVIFGSVHRALNLNTDTSNIQPFLKKTFYRLWHRGHKHNNLKNIFLSAIESILYSFDKDNPPVTNHPPNNKNDLKPLYLQLPFNPFDPPRKSIQQAFKNHIIQPKNDRHISLIPTLNVIEGPVDFDRLQVCYLKQKNLGAVLSPQKLRIGTFSVGKFFATIWALGIYWRTSCY